MPAHAALLIASAGIWSRIPLLRRDWLPIAAGVVVAVLACLAIGRLENRHRPAAQALASCRPETVSYNYYANKVAGSVEAKSYRLVDEQWNRGQLLLDQRWYHGHVTDVLVLAPSVQSNQPGAASSLTWPSGPPRLEGGRCRLVGSYAIYDFSGRCPPSARPAPQATVRE